jgi:MFS family permease
MTQWASAFTESALGVSKTIGDLAGPCMFATFMGISRVFYGKKSEKLNLSKVMLICATMGVACYLIAALSPIAVIGLIGCALCGLAVGIMWPGTYSLAAKKIPFGGVRMFALLALAGDIGCLVGPTGAGWIADAAGENLKLSFLICTIFPIAIISIIISIFGIKNHKNTGTDHGN